MYISQDASAPNRRAESREPVAGRRWPTADGHSRRTALGSRLTLLDLTEYYSPQGGGVRTYLTEKARWLAGRDDVRHVVVVPGPRHRRHTLFGSAVHEIGGPPVPGSPGYRVLLDAPRLRDILAEERPDVVELGSVYLAPWLLRGAVQRLTGVIGFFHMDLAGVALRALPRWVPAVVRRAAAEGLHRYLRAVYRDCECVIGTTPAAVSVMATAGITRTELVPFGVDATTFHPGRRDPTWKTELGVGRDRPVALYVGRLAVEKNLRVVLDALPELHRETGVVLVCIGAGSFGAELRAFGRAHPGMLVELPFEDDRARLARAYASADLLVAPFPHETFGLSALEAAACGLPIVTAEEGAIGARLSGVRWARRFPAHDPGALGTAVRDLLGSLTSAVRAEARATAERETWDRTFSRLLDIYREAGAAANRSRRNSARPSPAGSTRV